MKSFFAILLLLSSAFIASAQKNITPFPKAVFTAKTVAIINNTHNEAVEQGANEVLKRWGHFTIVDDPEAADIVLSFDKSGGREGRSSQSTDASGKPDYSYSMSFSSTIRMKASLKGVATSFYSTSTGDSKKKAGASCVNDLQSAYLADH